jgi:hypothetical protein
MSAETGSFLLAAAAVAAGVGVFVALRKKHVGGALSCVIVGGLATTICYGLGQEARQPLRRHASRHEARERLLAAYPLEAVKERLPVRAVPSVGDVLLSSEARADLDLTEKATDWRERRRRELLQGVHEGTVEVFADEIGQGYSRMPSVTKKVLDDLARKDENPHQPEIIGSPDAPQPPAGEGPIATALKALHRFGVEEFANAQDFGFVTADGRAAGFLSHRFTKPVKADPRRRLQRFDLVGLVMHDEPVVYVSDKLPRMDELKTVAKRPLDDFETAAVRALRDGEAVVIHDDHATTRMVGAVRAAKQCLTCHETRRGELLGAFTYRFERP